MKHPVVTPILAAVFDLAAIAGLTLVVAGAARHGEGLGWVFIGMLLGPFAAPGAVLSSIALVESGRVRGVRSTVTVPIAAVLSVLSIVIGPIGMGFGWSIAPNPAADRTASLRQTIERMGGIEVCSDGDGGLGPDNLQAWDDRIYRIPDEDRFAERLADSDAARALDLSADDTSKPSESGFPVPGAARRLTAPAGGADRIRVEVIVAATSPRSPCADPYGAPYVPPRGHRVVEIHSRAPEQH